MWLKNAASRTLRLNLLGRKSFWMMGESGSIFVPVGEGPANGVHGTADTSKNLPLGVSCTAPDLAQVAAKIDSLKKWTVTTYKTTKQTICENLGKVERTVDKELEERVEALKDLHRRYNQVFVMSRHFNMYFHQMHETQKGLAESLYQLSLRETSLTKECVSNSDSLRTIAHNGELLERSLSYFLSSLGTLCDKTIEDTLLTVHSHDQARLEYDVHRHEVAALRSQAHASPEVIALAEQRCKTSRERYEQLKDDVKVKMTLLEENRLKVMRKQLALLHNAMMAYFSGNAKALQLKLDELALEQKESSDCVAPSFLEH